MKLINPKLRPLVGVVAIAMLGACQDPRQYAGQMPLISVDEQGRPQQIFVSQEQYGRELSTVAESVQESVVPTLEHARSTYAAANPYLLRTFVLGTGVNIEFGIGPVVKMAVNPRLRLMFTNSTSPTLP